jgi:para-nitrobenzyl esterase
MTKLKRWLTTALAAGLVGGLCAGQAVASGSGDVVTTDNGRVRGAVTSEYRSYSGIPYAAPPVGPLRWASPAPARSWSGVRDATKPGDICAQNPGLLGEPVSYSEDCLYLNVTTPRHARKRPVMVWLHGGGFRNGAGSMYGPADMVVRGDVVVVTVNYRLSVFGFLAHPSLGSSSGNFGLEDQQAALRWVQRNAAAFGGDPANVTVFGESAGGVSTCSQLVSPTAAGLFHRAVIQSGPCTMGIWPNLDGTPDPTGTWLPRSREAADRHGLGVAAELGCPEADATACLRAKPASELLPQAEFGFGPVVGGGVLPLFPKDALATGKFNKVPVMHGITRHEYRLFTAAQEFFGAPPLTDAGYRSLVAAFVGQAKAPAVLDKYRGHGSPSEAWSAVMTDAVFARATSDMSRQLSRHVPTYTFEFADTEAPQMTTVPKPSFPLGAYHAAEVQYLFDSDYFDRNAMTDAQQRLSETMIRYWTRFAHTGSPNNAGTPWWPRSAHLAQELDTDHSGPIDFGREHNYGFWR